MYLHNNPSHFPAVSLRLLSVWMHLLVTHLYFRRLVEKNKKAVVTEFKSETG